MKNKFERFIPITKVDEDEHMVYGWASTPDLDSDGEVITVAAMEKALPGYMKFPTIREMHQAKAAGKTVTAEIRNGAKEKGLYIGAKIVAEDAWKLVKEGVYGAFSIGGNVVQKVNNTIHALELIEISLVDVPANKSAVIEVWKRGKVSKSAETAYQAANLMIQIKDMIYMYEYQGKKHKQLDKMLEMAKQLVSTEAQESEPQDTDSYIASRIASLEKLDLTDKNANLIREGVIMAMKTKAEQLKKDAETLDETVNNSEETVDETATEDVADTDDATDTAENAEDTEAEDDSDEDEDTEGDKEASSMPALKKLDAINKQLAQLSPEKAKAEKLTLQKTINAMAGTIAKMSDYLVELSKRLDQVEKRPAAAKSKAAYIFKSNEEKPTAEQSTTVSPELTAKKARLEEVTKLFDTMTPNEFAKRGLSQEAQKLENEIGRLSA